MYIPIPIMLFVGGVVICVLFAYAYFNRWIPSKQTKPHEEPSHIIAEQIWRDAGHQLRDVLKASCTAGELKTEMELLKAMEDDISFLRNLYSKHPTMQIEIAEDWIKYISAIDEIKLAKERHYVDAKYSPLKKFQESHQIMMEIENRVGKLLSGREAISIKIRDRLLKTRAE